MPQLSRLIKDDRGRFMFIGDAANLQGGILILTSLRGADGQVYALAQGAVVTGGFSAGRGSATQTVNHPTVGRAPNAATVERAAPSVEPKSVARLQLRDPDFTTSARIVEAVNKKFGSAGKPAKAAKGSRGKTMAGTSNKSGGSS